MEIILIEKMLRNYKQISRLKRLDELSIKSNRNVMNPADEIEAI